MEVGDGVDEFNILLGAQLLLKHGKVDAVLLNGHAGEAGAEASVAVERAEERRLLADNAVAVVEERLAHKAHHLLSAAGDYDGVVLAEGVVAVAGELFKLLDEGGVALAHAVLQHEDRLCVDDFFYNSLHIRNGKGVGRGVAGGEGYGVAGAFEYLPYD